MEIIVNVIGDHEYSEHGRKYFLIIFNSSTTLQLTIFTRQLKSFERDSKFSFITIERGRRRCIKSFVINKQHLAEYSRV